jgi:hypothetical protein
MWSTHEPHEWGNRVSVPFSGASPSIDRPGRQVVYAPWRDPRVQQLTVDLGMHLAEVICAGADAVSPHQRDPDGHRRVVTTQIARHLLAQVYTMVGEVTAAAVTGRRGTLGSLGAAVQRASQASIRQPTPQVVVRRTPPVSPPHTVPVSRTTRAPRSVVVNSRAYRGRPSRDR